MPSRPVLDALSSGGLFLTFLAPSCRFRPAARPAQRHASTVLRHPTTVNRPQRRSSHGDSSRGSSRRSLSGLADERREGIPRLEDGVYIPIASTSAVRLDSPPPVGPSTTASDPSIPSTPSLSPRTNEPTANPVRAPSTALSTVLSRLRELHTASPSASPLDIVRHLRAVPPTEGSTQLPPTPPPPIPLDPPTHTSDNRFLTPFLLHALFLGASAFGLLARRKVKSTDASRCETTPREAERRKQEAEDRVDELQALNLLLGVYAAPEAVGVTGPKQSWDWRKGALQPVTGLVELAQELEPDRQSVSAVLHYVGPRFPSLAIDSSMDAQKLREARPRLIAWAWRAYRALPPLSPHPPSTNDFSLQARALDNAIIRTFLDSIYADASSLQTPPATKERVSRPGHDRRILDALAERFVSDPSQLTSDLCPRLADAAFRARRLDLLVALLHRSPPLERRLQLAVAGRALDVLAKEGYASGKGAVFVLPVVEAFSKAVHDVDDFGAVDLATVQRGLQRICRLATGVALERYVVEIALYLVARAPEASVRQGPLVSDALKHLVRSRNFKSARRILGEVPPHLVQLEHYEIVLRSSHLPTAQTAWDSLLRSDALMPQLFSYLAFLHSHATTKVSSSVLDSAFRTISLMNRAGMRKTIDVYNILLRVLVRYASDPALRRCLRRMEADGIAHNEETAGILDSRSSVRRDTQSRRIVVLDDFGQRETRLVERPRRCGGRSQLAKVAEAVRTARAALADSPRSPKKDSRAPPFVSLNPLLRSITRWPCETDSNKLVHLARLQLGVDLSTILADPRIQVEKANLSRFRQPLQAHELSSKWFYSSRRPVYLTFAKAFENRNERKVGAAVRKMLKLERHEVERARRREQTVQRKKAEAAREAEEARRWNAE
ncbi:hypothetical protein JCM11641_002659 [Rhodosporidiobolus odoratus]